MRQPKLARLEPTVLADMCFAHLTDEPEELARFMTMTGYTSQSLRAALQSGQLGHALIDYFAGNEPLLLTLCTKHKIGPEQFMQVWYRLNRGG